MLSHLQTSVTEYLIINLDTCTCTVHCISMFVYKCNTDVDCTDKPHLHKEIKKSSRCDIHVHCDNTAISTNM